jgi:hypothetical protein
MTIDSRPDRHVTLLDAMIGLTEFAALVSLLAAAMRSNTERGAEPPLWAIVYVTVVASLPLAIAWWLGVRFANESGRRGFWARLAAHLMSVVATAALMVATLLTCGMPLILVVAWWTIEPRTGQASEAAAASRGAQRDDGASTGR